MKPSKLYPWRLRAALAGVGVGMLALFASINANAQSIQWISADVGGPTFQGSSVLNPNGTVSIAGGGSDIWNTSSQFHYYYAWASGTSWEMSAQFQSFWGPDAWSKIELLVDQADTTLGPQGGDPFIAMMDTLPTTFIPPYTTDGATGVGDGGVDQWRSAANGNSDWKQAGTTPAPAYPNDWFKIQRTNSIFNLYKSSDGINWNLYIGVDTSSKSLVGQDNGTTFGTPWPDLVAVGVAVTAHYDAWTDPITGLPAGATGVVANVSATFPAAQPPTALGVTQPIQGVATNVIGGEASLSFVATNNAVPVGTIPTVYQWYKNGTALPGATNSFHTWLLDVSDNGAQYSCKAGCPVPYTSVPQLQSGTATAKVLQGTYFTNGFRIEMFNSANVSLLGVEQGNVPPAAWINLVPNCYNPGGLGNYYVTRVSGWFIPPTSDTYTFFDQSDDQSDLFLSTDNTIANKRLIAQETEWSNLGQWFTSGGVSNLGDKRSDQWVDVTTGQSPWAAGFALTKGLAYYIEQDHYQGNGGDAFAFTYQTASMIAAGGGSLPGTLFDDYTNSLFYATNLNMMYATIPATTLTWLTQPTNTVTSAGYPAHFYTQAASDSEFAVQYQWYLGTPPTGTLIAGATTANWSTASLTAADSGNTYYVVASTAENEVPSITSVTASVEVGAPVLEKGWALDEYFYTANPGVAAFEVTKTNSGVPTVYYTPWLGGGPDDTIVQPRLEGSSKSNEAGDNYTERTSAIFYPPTTANYVFFINSDDDSALFVSTDVNASNAVMVAQETEWSNPWQWQQEEGVAAVGPQKCSVTWADINGNSPWLNGIPMTQGQPYFVVAVHHEGGGGDNVEATFMTMAQYTASQNLGPANGTYSAFTGNLIATYVPQSFSCIFTQQPGTVNVPLNGIATLTAAASTDSTTAVGDNNDPRNEWNNVVVYQWLKNGNPIAGANSSAYSFGPVSPQDTSIQFLCTARSMGLVDKSGNPLWVTSTVANIVVTGGAVYEPGFALHEWWNLNPGRVAVGNNTAGAPNWVMAIPAFEFVIDSSDASVGDNYTDCILGYFIPPANGNYNFFCNSDDDSDLYLSTDSSASSKRLVSQETGWDNNARDWGTTSAGGTATQVRSDTFVDPSTGLVPYSTGIPLVKGQKYFMFMPHHQGGGGTYNCADATLVGSDPAANSPSLITGSSLGCYVTPCTNVAFTTQPQPVTVVNYANAAFTVAGTTDSTTPIGNLLTYVGFFNNFLQYQWYKNGAAVAGATSSAFGIPQVLPSDNNDQIYCTMRALGYADNAGNALWATSQVATITVTTTAPQLLYAATYLNTNSGAFSEPVTNYITVAFSTPMDPVALGQISTYTLPSSLTIVGIIVNTNNYRSVALAVTGTVTLPINVSVSSALKGLGGGMPITGTLSTAVSNTELADKDIGVPGSDPAWPGMMYVDGPNAYTIACEGSDIWNSEDGFNFAYEQKSGDFDVVVRQKDIKHTSNWAKGGLMVREDLSAGSRDWNIINDPLASDGIPAPDGSGFGASFVECNCRYTNEVVAGVGNAPSQGWIGEITPRPAPTYPNAWVRIARKGTVLMAYCSTDGVNWIPRATNDTAVVGTGGPTPLPNTVYVGLCTTAHNNDPVGATFDQLIYLNTVSYDSYNSSYVAVTTKPTMTAAKNGSNITISWTPTGGTLYSSPVLGAGASWTLVGTANPATVPITGAAQFFRVKAN